MGAQKPAVFSITAFMSWANVRATKEKTLGFYYKNSFYLVDTWRGHRNPKCIALFEMVMWDNPLRREEVGGDARQWGARGGSEGLSDRPGKRCAAMTSQS
jgi:hypothetical protein